VRDKATGKPLAGVKMSAQQTNAITLTDHDGRFEILGCPRLEQGYLVMAQPQTSSAYFAALARVPETAGLDPRTVDFDLVSGIPLSGRVTDLTTQKPPRAAVVEYFPLYPNPHSSRISNGFLAASSTLIGPDGSYSLVVLPRPGVVCVAASPRNSYAAAVVGDNELARLGSDRGNQSACASLQTAGGVRGRGVLIDENKYHALSLINPDEKAEPLALDLTLQPAAPLEGTVVGPEGKPLTGVHVIGLTALPKDEVLDGASFTVTGLNPRRGRSLFFHHRDKGLGKVLTIRGDESGPLTVQLDPCGSVLGRIVDRDGKPVPEVKMRLIPVFANAPVVTAQSDRDGRFREALAPGQRYRLELLSSRRLLREVPGLEVESGRSRDLGDLPLAE
jgi:hypothetical protein